MVLLTIANTSRRSNTIQAGLLAHASSSSTLPGICQWFVDSSSFTVAGAAADFHRFPF